MGHTAPGMMQQEPESPAMFSHPSLPRLMLLCVLVLLATWAAMMWPFNFGPRDGVWLSMQPREPAQLLLRMLLFVPLGFCEAWLVGNALRVRNAALVMVAIDAALVSIIGETAQWWLPGRTSSLLDVVANTLGGVVGGMLGVALSPRLNARFWPDAS